MKKALLLSVLFLISCTVWGQLSLSIQKIDSTTTDAGLIDVALNIVVTNIGTSKATVLWERTINSIPQGWITYVCTGTNCYPPSAKSDCFDLAPGASSDILVHFQSGAINGLSDVDIKITDKNNPSNTVTANYKFRLTSVSTSESFANSIKVFPNPTTEYFSVSNRQNISKVSLTSLTGRTIHVYNNSLDRCDVSDLPGGIYILQFFDNKNKLVKSSRLAVKKP